MCICRMGTLKTTHLSAFALNCLITQQSPIIQYEISNIPGEMEIIIYHYSYSDYVPTGKREREREREREAEREAER